MPKRKAVMIEEDLVEQVKTIAQRYGMSLSAYMRRLLRLAIESEIQGIHAPQAISRGVVLSTLARLSLVPLPLQLLDKHDEKELKSIGKKLGAMLHGLGIDIFDLISLIVESSGIGFSTPTGIKIIITPNDTSTIKLEAYLVALAKAAGLQVEKPEKNITIIRYETL